jgi:tRNA threonylcarbamoyladenosine biosynthesis protein TsaB
VRLLAIDTAGADLSVACDDQGSCLARAMPLERGHAELLLPLLRALMAEAGWRWADLDLLAVSLGPGGFTGLRAGVAVTRALALALDRPTLGVGSLEALGSAALAAAPPQTRGRPLLAVMDARRGEIYFQPFDAALHALAPARVGTPSAAAGALAPGMWLAGRAARLVVPALAERAVVVEVPLCARYVARLARRRLAAGAGPVAGSALCPLYVRSPDARLDAGRPLVARPGPR